MKLIDIISSPRVKFGLLFGSAGLLLAVVGSYLLGFCGTAAGLLAGIAAGFFTSSQEEAPTPQAASRSAMISGTIAGGMVMVGQMVGSAISIAAMQAEQLSLLMQVQPGGTSLQSVRGLYWSSGLGFAFCLGLTGLAVSAMAGGTVGFLVARRSRRGKNR